MSCCAAMTPEVAIEAHRRSRLEELTLASATPRDGVRLLRLSTPDMHCGGCVASVEHALAAAPGVISARANLTSKTVTVEWRDAETDAAAVADAVEAAIGRVFALDDDRADDAEAAESRDLLQRVAVAGFASANIMLLSVAIWSGAEGATRDLMHWISAAIALPTALYAGRPFYVSAWRGLRAGRLNMDAPITLAIILACGVSLSETLTGGADAYFDAAATLIFLLLIGRWLDRSMRAKARSAARALARLAPRGAWVETSDGRDYRPLAALRPGDRIQAAAGERIAVDGIVVAGRGALDLAFLTGEATPTPVAQGDRVEAGALAIEGPLTVQATRVGEDTTLAEIGRLVAAAEERKSRLARLADQAARIYAPLIHGLALVVFCAWMFAGAEPRDALLVATALLIVTCPCALGLAAPMAQAVASGALYRRGVMLKDGAALERLAQVRAVAFDKTGVLTMAAPHIAPPPGLSADRVALIGALAGASSHPLARAVAAWSAEASDNRGAPPLEDVSETVGSGVGAVAAGRRVRLGARDFVAEIARSAPDAQADVSAVWFAEEGGDGVVFHLRDPIRPGAAETVAALKAAGLRPAVLSGDRAGPVAALAAQLGVADARPRLRPEDKCVAIDALAAQRGPVLMVGDGVNDAPALAAAAVSMAPASAADVGRAAADVVFTGRSLTAVWTTWRAARKTRAVILQNFALAAVYNAIAAPLAAFGAVGPLEAAIAMSTSSLLVTLNALRLARAPDLQAPAAGSVDAEASRGGDATGTLRGAVA